MNRFRYSTVVGIGLDFNADLTGKILRAKGANYFSVKSSAEFKKRLDSDFEYIVTPLVFNMELSV